ncbi:MAG: ankyrin repeat domain-containing protein, partial [Vicinamibacterales bacterium]
AVGAAALCSAAMLAAAPTNAPVADAAVRGDRHAVRALLQQGADVNAAHGDGMTALHWAAERGDAEMAEMLVYAGANVAAGTRIGQYTPLHIASTAGSAPVVQTLLNAGAGVDARSTNTGVTALHLAAASGDPAVVTLLLDHGAEANAREAEWGQTPLIFAAAQNRVEAVRVLLARGADPGIATRTADLAHHALIDRAATERQRKVLAGFTAGSQTSPTPSQVQAAMQAARELYRSGKVPPPEKPEAPDASAATAGGAPNPRDPTNEEINPPVTTKGGLTALLHAARQGHLDVVRALVDGGAEVNQAGAGDGTSPLLMAVINGQFDTALYLIARGADPNRAAGGNGVTPLWAAVNAQWQPRTRFPQPQEMSLQQATYLDVMKALLAAGADPNARLRSHPWFMVYSGCGNRNCGLADTSGSTAFWRAAYSTDLEAMRLLAAHGADPNIPTIAPRQAIRRGGAGGRGDQGAQGGGVDQAGRPAGAGGAIPPVPDANQPRYAAPPIPYGGPGALPVHAAAGVEYGEGFAGNAHRHAPGGWLPVMQYLVEELGADVNARDNDGYTPLHHAAARGDNDVILYLVEKGADVTAVARSGQTTADMANGPVQRVSPFPDTVALLMKLGSKNSNKCVSC